MTHDNISILAKPPEKNKRTFYPKGAFIQASSHLISFRAKDRDAKWMPARFSWFSCAVVRSSSSYISLRPNLVAFLREMVGVVLILPYHVICLLNKCDYVMSIRHTASRCPRIFSFNPLLRGSKCISKDNIQLIFFFSFFLLVTRYFFGICWIKNEINSQMVSNLNIIANRSTI